MVLDRRSKPDLRSVWDRLSPTVLLSSSVRVSTPFRRSLPERRPTSDRLSSTAMIVSPKINRYVCNDGEAYENRQLSWSLRGCQCRFIGNSSSKDLFAFRVHFLTKHRALVLVCRRM